MKQYELKWLRHGQQRPYGDSYYDCEIHTTEEMTDEEIIAEVNKIKKYRFEQIEGTMRFEELMGSLNGAED